MKTVSRVIFAHLVNGYYMLIPIVGVPSVQKIEATLTSRYSIEYVIREFQSIVNNLAQDSPGKVFKLVERETLYLPYTPVRAPQQVLLCR